MPWETPSLREVRSLVRDQIRASLPGADAMVANSVLRVMADATGATCHLTLQYLDWLALQLLPDTAEIEWLDRHGDIWLVNADGSTGRKMATLATGHASFVGVAGTYVPANTRMSYGGTQMEYETTAFVVLAASDVPTSVPITALEPGSQGNLLPGTTLTPTPEIPGVTGTITVIDLENGTDTESDDDLRIRVLERIRQPPQGGAAHDYVRWAKAVPGCTRAWCIPNEMGLGTVTVRVLFDELRASDDGWPTQDDLNAVTGYIDTVRPVAVKDFWVVAPIKHAVDVQIANLTPDNVGVRAGIEESLKQMLVDKAAPGQTIYAAWKSYAIMSAPDVVAFDLVNSADDVMPSPGHMAVLGDIQYEYATNIPIAT